MKREWLRDDIVHGEKFEEQSLRMFSAHLGEKGRERESGFLHKVSVLSSLEAGTDGFQSLLRGQSGPTAVLFTPFPHMFQDNVCLKGDEGMPFHGKPILFE